MSQYTESGMTFEYDADYVFLPEQSLTYQELVKSNSIKACDFVLCKKNKLLFIEAKTTAPRNDKDFQDIYFKFIHTLLLYLGIKFGRPFKVQTTLPTNLSAIDIGKVEIIPVLIVRDHKKDDLSELTDSIRKEIKGIEGSKGIRKAYCLDDVIVLNEELARKQGFIV